MSESTPSSTGLFAFPISDPPLKFHRFLYQYGHQLGQASGAVIHWRPIGDPAQCGDEYRSARTSALQNSDAEDSRLFKDEVALVGSKEWIYNREYLQYAKILGVENIEPPLVVFTAKPLKERAILKFEPLVFDQPERSRKLAAILVTRLTEQAFKALRKDGVFTNREIEAVQQYLWNVGKEIFKIYSSPKKRFPSYLKVGISNTSSRDCINPGQDTKLRWWLKDDGSLSMHTVTKGEVDGKVTFSLVNGSATKQQNLMMLLIHKYPGSITLGDVLHEIYPDSQPLDGRDANEISSFINRARSLVNAVRKKLEKTGIPENILPSVKLDMDLCYELRLDVTRVLRPKGNR